MQSFPPNNAFNAAKQKIKLMAIEIVETLASTENIKNLYLLLMDWCPDPLRQFKTQQDHTETPLNQPSAS